MSQYEIVLRSQAGAEELLRNMGALEEISEAVLSHCEAHHPEPKYLPQEYKRRLAEFGWIPEVRVPPYSPDLDEWSINERYDAFKFFASDSTEVGVAIEMEGWQINNDLLKFRRGFHRGQIAAGVLLQPDYYDLSYCFDRMRHVNEPLFGEIPILFVCARGPGLKEPVDPRSVTYGPFLMPKRPATEPVIVDSATEPPFARYRGGGRMLLGVPPQGDGSSRHGYGIPVVAECGSNCVYCGYSLHEPYEAWLGFSIDHVIPTNTVKLGYDKTWVADLINLVTSCRACNEFLNQYRVDDPPPVTLTEFCELRDRHFLAKREWVVGRHERERSRYEKRRSRVSAEVSDPPM